MKCLIIAAGNGSRIVTRSLPKPLIPVLGKPLIERVIESAEKAGVTGFFVVIGFQAERVEKFLSRISALKKIEIHCILDKEWGKGTGVSVRAAKDVLKEKFVLLMADHIFEPTILGKILKTGIQDNEVVLAVDSHIQNPFVDKDDAMKVFVQNGVILDIGKKIQRYNGFDTGIFYCSQSLFDSLEGVNELAEGIKKLSRSGKVKAMWIDGEYWVDVDDEKALKRAQKLVSGGQERLNMVS